MGRYATRTAFAARWAAALNFQVPPSSVHLVGTCRPLRAYCEVRAHVAPGELVGGGPTSAAIGETRTQPARRAPDTEPQPHSHSRPRCPRLAFVPPSVHLVKGCRPVRAYSEVCDPRRDSATDRKNNIEPINVLNILTKLHCRLILIPDTTSRGSLSLNAASTRRSPV
jgi:hypothetical protein